MKEKKATTRARRGKSIRQVAALPFRRAASGEIEFLILTSRTTRRFVIPKGWPMKGLSDAAAAATEASDEAGVSGEVSAAPIGSYRYWKRLRSAFIPIDVAVFALHVTDELANWAERRQRQKQWIRREEAVRLIDEPDLASLMAAFEP